MSLNRSRPQFPHPLINIHIRYCTSVQSYFLPYYFHSVTPLTSYKYHARPYHSLVQATPATACFALLMMPSYYYYDLHAWPVCMFVWLLYTRFIYDTPVCFIVCHLYSIISHQYRPATVVVFVCSVPVRNSNLCLQYTWLYKRRAALTVYHIMEIIASYRQYLLLFIWYNEVPVYNSSLCCMSSHWCTFIAS